jgi:hypothetical protein
MSNRIYLEKLAETLKKAYSFALLCADEHTFVLSDQYLSTVALSYKNQFINSSNRAIGLERTMVLLPLSSFFYIALFHGNTPKYISANTMCHLTAGEVHKLIP